jgi:hypothetical protein
MRPVACDCRKEIKHEGDAQEHRAGAKCKQLTEAVHHIPFLLSAMTTWIPKVGIMALPGDLMSTG